MPTSYTPLRYPGGKAKFGPYLSSVLKQNGLVDCEYGEPYAGGAGAGLFLLFRGYARRLRLNDIDAGVVSFWRAVLGETERFARRVERVPLTLREWDKQKAVVRSGGHGFELGFAFFYLNRTNRSGIMNAGVIGGRSQQGAWRIDARFNRAELADRVRAIGAMRRSISISQEDALVFLGEAQVAQNASALTYLDPPYFGKGHELYTNFYCAEDHARIAAAVRPLKRPWIMTYDSCPEIRALYGPCHMVESALSYSAREVRRGKELVIFGGGLRAPRYEPKTRRYRAGFEVL